MEYKENNFLIFKINNPITLKVGKEEVWERINLSNFGTQYFDCILQA